MAQLVLIKTETANAKSGDLISVNKDNSIPENSPGYQDLALVTVSETVQEIEDLRRLKRPEIRRAATENKYDINIDSSVASLSDGMTSTILRNG